MKLFTIGYQNHKIDSFIGSLKKYNVTAIADVRSIPYGKNPDFNKQTLATSLNRDGIAYSWLGAELGARPQDESCYLNGIAHYHLIAQTAKFKYGLERLRKGLTKFNIALMCFEKDPIICHRAILVCPHLSPDYTINHILNNSRLESHLELEQRMINVNGLNTTNLFDQDVDSFEVKPKAYQLQADKIAYRKK